MKFLYFPKKNLEKALLKMQRCDKRGDDEMTQNDICSPPGALTGAPVAFHFFIKGERNCIHLGQNLTVGPEYPCRSILLQVHRERASIAE